MHGEGQRRKCPECGQSVTHIEDNISHRELRGPRNITSSNGDRLFDDGGRRFLFIEEKHTNEPPASRGQKGLLQGLASQPNFTVWACKGVPSRLTLFHVLPHGEGFTVIGEDKDFDWYQEQVYEWFAQPATPPATMATLAALKTLPFGRPPDIPDELDWAVIDKHITGIAMSLSRVE